MYVHLTCFDTVYAAGPAQSQARDRDRLFFSIISRPGPERKKSSFQDLELDNRPGLYYNTSCASYIFVLFLIQTGRI